MTIDNFCFYWQNRLIQTSQTGGQWYSDTSPLVFPVEMSDWSSTSKSTDGVSLPSIKNDISKIKLHINTKMS
jgi:hypothetical protein